MEGSITMARGKTPAYQYDQQRWKDSLRAEWSHLKDKNLEYSQEQVGEMEIPKYWRV